MGLKCQWHLTEIRTVTGNQAKPNGFRNLEITSLILVPVTGRHVMTRDIFKPLQQMLRLLRPHLQLICNHSVITVYILCGHKLSLKIARG